MAHEARTRITFQPNESPETLRIPYGRSTPIPGRDTTIVRVHDGWAVCTGPQHELAAELVRICLRAEETMRSRQQTNAA